MQLARLAGLRVLTIVDKAKHGLRDSVHDVLRPDLLVDSYDPDRAVDIIRSNLIGQLRFGIDTRGKDTAGHLLRALSREEAKLDSSLGRTDRDGQNRAHLVGLTGLPKTSTSENVVFHNVPIKLFHVAPPVGERLTL